MEADAEGEAERVGVGLAGSGGDTDTDGRAERSRPAGAGWLAGRGARERTHRGRRGRLATSADRATRYASTCGDAQITQFGTRLQNRAPERRTTHNGRT